jgi:predicted nucleic acid-binding protein
VSLAIALDAGPLGLLTHRKDSQEAEACRKWLAAQIAGGSQIIVPAIADYEVRRELLRAGKSRAIARLDDFLHATPDRYLPPSTEAFQKAAELWAKIRNEGLPTAGQEALDADVLLVAQLLTSKYAAANLVVATTNAKHIARFIDAREWQNI